MPPTFDIGAFRTSFPEFSDTTKYPTSTIEMWSGLAVMQVRTCIWKNTWNLAVSLYTAHCITLAAQNLRAAETAGTPGTSGGIANTKTVGSATVGYDSVTTAEKDAGWWNLTNYGKQFFRLAQMFGTRPIQL